MRWPKYLLVSLLTGIIMTTPPLIAGAAPPEAESQNLEGRGEQTDLSTSLATAFSPAARNPLTYAPAALVGVASSLDWASSQRYFRQGWFESNPGFSVSGNRNAEPLSPGAGYRRLVVHEVLPVLATSIAVNTFSYWLEQKGLRRVGRILRWTTGGALTAVSARSFRQWQRNLAGTP